MGERGTKENQVTSTLLCVLWKMSHHFKSLFMVMVKAAQSFFSRVIADIILSGSMIASTHQETFVFSEPF